MIHIFVLIKNDKNMTSLNHIPTIFLICCWMNSQLRQKGYVGVLWKGQGKSMSAKIVFLNQWCWEIWNPYTWKKIEWEKVKKRIRKRESHEVKSKSTKRNWIPQTIHRKWIKVWLISTREGETKYYKNHISWIHNSLSLNDYTYLFSQSCFKPMR